MSADRTFDWWWRSVAVPVRYDLFGANDRVRVLLLPALSTVSTRDEMAALARLLSRGRGVLVTDWPGFGDNPRPALDYEPDLYRAFLEALLAHLGDPPGARAVVAAGHAAAYAIDLEARRPATFAKLVLIAPTWRGPLPTVRPPADSEPHSPAGPDAGTGRAALQGQRLPPGRSDDVQRPCLRRPGLHHVRSSRAAHAAGATAGRPLRLGVLRHGRPGSVPQPRELPRRRATARNSGACDLRRAHAAPLAR
jgi:hypothetical protein